MSRPRAMSLLLAVSVLASACSEGSGAVSQPTPSATPSPSPAVVVDPPGVVVDNVAFGRSKKRVAKAVRDLKAVRLWRPLTGHLYGVKFGSRLGAVNIPDDGHLADAVVTVAQDGNAAGRLCDVMFFPNAIARDLERWRMYHQQGAISDPAPTLRQLWGAVMAHELAHCFPDRPGERIARRWEAKALRRLRNLSR